MSDRILGRAYDKRLGMCSVEHVGGDQFRLTPDRDPNNRHIRPRAAIHWRNTESQEAAA